MELLFASGNSHKRDEFSRILEGHTILLPSDIGIDFHFDENGKDYYENSLGKALTLYKLTGKPVIADDSGLSVVALDGAPGIYSARYGSEELGRKLTDSELVDYLLKKMEGIEDRRAFFVCSMVFLLDEYRIFSAQETVKGVIAQSPAGKGGFGYDPVFYLEEYGKTIAEIGSEEKNKISHRGKAGAVMRGIIDSLV